MESIKKRIKGLLSGGFFHILIGGTMTKIIAFMSSICVVRLLPKEEYGYLAYVDNIYAYVLLIAGIGCSSAILKFCASDDTEKNKAYVIFGLKFGTTAQFLILIFMIVLFQYMEITFPAAKKYMYALLFYPFLYFWVGAIQSYMRALLKNKEFAYAGIIQSIIALLGSVGFVLIWGIYGIISARYLALIIVVVYCVRVIKNSHTQISSTEILTIQEKKQFVLLGLALLIANVFSMIMPINESFLINSIIKDANITAEYKVACLIPSQLPFFTSAIVTYYFPIFARIQDNRKAWQKMKEVGILTLVIISIVTTIGIIVSPIIIQIVYGKQYSGIFYIMTLLWIMNAINAGFRMLPLNILPALGYANFNVIIAMISCVVHFVIDFYCITFFGINGAVIAGGTIYILSGCAYWIYLKKKLVKEKIN